MKKDDERDETIDRLLRSTFATAAGADGVRTSCIDPEVIAAWTERNLAPREAAQVEAHLADCAPCQELVAILARTNPPFVAAQSLWQRWRLQWVVPIAAAATAVAVWVAVPDDRHTVALRKEVVPSAPPTPPLAEPPSSTVATDAAAARPQEKGEVAALRDQKSERTQARSENEARADTDETDRFRARQAAAETTAPPSAPAAAAAPAQEQNRALDKAERPESFLRAAAPTEIVSPDPLVRWRILASGRLERSTNAGKTWESVAFPQPLELVAVRAPSATTAIVTAVDGRQFRTDDQGKTWTAFTN